MSSDGPGISVRLLYLLLTGLVAVATAFTFPEVAGAREPPNQNDPCSQGGRNTCGTLGVGSYETYRYGLRWFGDYQGLVPGAKHAYCIDLRYWYPSASSRFREDSSETLRNRDGELVSIEKRRRMAYAVWADGRTSTPTQAAAVMLYVHGLMGDGAPGEVAPDALGAPVAETYARIASDAARFHGPYRIEARLPARLRAGTRVTGTARVLSASGNALPGIALHLGAPGARGLPERVETNANGVATLSLTPTTSGPLQLRIRTQPLAATLPRVYQPTTPAASRNGQRIVVPASQVVTETVQRTVEKVPVTVSTTAQPSRVLIGEPSRDRVVVETASERWRATVSVRIFGPFPETGAIRCNGTPAWEGSFTTDGPGTYSTPPARLTSPGWYTYQLELPPDDTHLGSSTPCGVPEESFRVEAQPRLRTVVSATRVTPGATVTDTIEVRGLGRTSATIRAALYGPFPAREAIQCTGRPVWTGTVQATGDGRLVTTPVRLDVPGFYTYRESIAASGFVRAAQTACGEVAETTVVVSTPRLTTRVSSQRTSLGATVTDTVEVAGLGSLAVTVAAELFGPFPTREAIRCDGMPAWRGTLDVRGDGTYETAPFRVERPGFYTYRESIVAGPANEAVTTECGERTETTLARVRPEVTTVASAEVVVPGAMLHDRIRIHGLGRLRAVVELELFGPFASREAIRCTVAPIWRGRFTVEGDGVHRSPSVEVERAGFYAYRERIVESAVVEESRSACGVAPETALVRPLVVTGGAAATAGVAAAGASGRTPVRIRIPTLDIDARLTPSVVDVANGVLGVPQDIRRPGWWRDGAAPGDRTGAVLVAGHVDSASRGAGAFFGLESARRGTRVELETRDGRTRRYRVVSVELMPKEALPADIYSRRGRARLVLVTCGGPFDSATRHYRDNVVVTAVPV